MKFIAMIPARSGSTEVVNKNIRLLCGNPLISYSITAALECDTIDDVYLNSDSSEYLDLGTEWGAKVYKRSKKFAENDSSMLEVIQDFVKNINFIDKNYNAIVVLYPVYPMRNGKDLSEMINVFVKIGGNRPLIGFKKPKTHPYLCYQLDNISLPNSVINYDENIFYRRQSYPDYYEITHWACILPINSLDSLNNQLMNDNTYGYIIKSERASINIDTELDFQYAEYLMKNKYEY